MIRITDLKLPLGHLPDALRDAVAARLGLERDAAFDFTIARRANDPRRKSAILMVYSVDVPIEGEQANLLAISACPYSWTRIETNTHATHSATRGRL